MRIALYVAAAVGVLGTWASWQAGFTPEVALLRGTIAFMAVSAVGYAGALIVATAPPPAEQEDGNATSDAGEQQNAGAGADGASTDTAQRTASTALQSTEDEPGDENEPRRLRAA